jgi:hypothetical protein
VLRRATPGPWRCGSDVLRRTTDAVTVDLPSFERVRDRLQPGAAVVLVPSHRSYLDFVLCSYLAFARPDLGIRIPHIAATMEFGDPLLAVLSNASTAYSRKSFARVTLAEASGLQPASVGIRWAVVLAACWPHRPPQSIRAPAQTGAISARTDYPLPAGDGDELRAMVVTEFHLWRTRAPRCGARRRIAQALMR